MPSKNANDYLTDYLTQTKSHQTLPLRLNHVIIIICDFKKIILRNMLAR